MRVAREVVLEAARMLEGAQREIGNIRTKSTDRDLVTDWDIRVEEAIRARLQELSPGVPILGEEGGASSDDGGGVWWLVDPIDGTVNFAHGLPLFGVSVGLEVDGQIVAGAVSAPALGWLFCAHRGGGATMNGEPIRVSATQELSRAMLATGFPYDRAETRHNFPQWEHFQCRAGACRRFGAASLDLCMVARGWLDGFWETRLSPWDLAAGSLIIEEAGGTVTSITGQEFSAREGNAVASNGAIHKAILYELAAVGHPPS